METIEADWVSEPDMDEREVVSTEDYDFYWQDDIRKDQEIQALQDNENK